MYNSQRKDLSKADQNIFKWIQQLYSCITTLISIVACTVPLKSQLPVASSFLRDENRVKQESMHMFLVFKLKKQECKHQALNMVL